MDLNDVCVTDRVTGHLDFNTCPCILKEMYFGSIHLISMEITLLLFKMGTELRKK